MEVIRDRADNCIIVCSIENVDPMGVHTGDSITVAPALTLTDKEYQIMRNASIAVLREIGVETGGSNVQFAVDPDSGRLVVIEMNPRVSRSSALASKATGFPIAEPTIDYVVTKVPRFTFEKFPGTEPLLTTAMKSVGEAMSMGRTFAESLQKAMRSMETGLVGLDEVDIPGYEPGGDTGAIEAALTRATPDRLLVIAQAFREGLTLDRIQAACRYDPWFLCQISDIVAVEKDVRANGLPATARGLLGLKKMGFSDARLAALAGIAESDVAASRRALDVHPVFKRVDTCAAEFDAGTPYMYASYDGDHADTGLSEDEAAPSDRRKVMILGGGPNHIVQDLKYDYC
jgi:carbamoyl-phosphate synthase large subunit